MANHESRKKAKTCKPGPVVRVTVRLLEGTIVTSRELPPSTTVGELKTIAATESRHPASVCTLASGTGLSTLNDAHSLASLGSGEEPVDTNGSFVEMVMLVKAYDIDSDRTALTALYHRAHGTHWLNRDGWLTAAPVGDWYGVAVENERVVGLVLESNNLQGGRFFAPSTSNHIPTVIKHRSPPTPCTLPLLSPPLSPVLLCAGVIASEIAILLAI